MTIDAYRTLYEVSTEYGKRKMSEAERGKPEMQQQIAKLTAERDALRKLAKRLEAKHSALLRAVDEQQLADNKRFSEEKGFLERTKTRLLQQLEAVKEAQEAERRALRAE